MDVLACDPDRFPPGPSNSRWAKRLPGFQERILLEASRGRVRRVEGCAAAGVARTFHAWIYWASQSTLRQSNRSVISSRLGSSYFLVAPRSHGNQHGYRFRCWKEADDPGSDPKSRARLQGAQGRGSCADVTRRPKRRQFRCRRPHWGRPALAFAANARRNALGWRFGTSVIARRSCYGRGPEERGMMPSDAGRRAARRGTRFAAIGSAGWALASAFGPLPARAAENTEIDLTCDSTMDMVRREVHSGIVVHHNLRIVVSKSSDVAENRSRSTGRYSVQHATAQVLGSSGDEGAYASWRAAPYGRLVRIENDPQSTRTMTVTLLPGGKRHLDVVNQLKPGFKEYAFLRVSVHQVGYFLSYHATATSCVIR
jgi:hypothetical protein